MPQATTSAGRATRKRDSEDSRNRILLAARDEFAAAGFAGARIDLIAERAEINKRMLYHYFGNKQDLYIAVMEEVYREIREGEQELRLDDLSPDEGMDHLTRFTFRHFEAHPWFVRLLMHENVLNGENLAGNPQIEGFRSPLVAALRRLLRRGAAEGLFRDGIDATHLYLTVAALGFFYLSNASTLSIVFEENLKSRRAINAWESHCVDVVMRYVLSDPDAR